MINHKAICLLIEDIERIQDSLFMCGLNSAPESISENCSNIAQECKKYGLEFAGERLMCIAEAIDKRRHTVEYNFNDVVHQFCVLSCYLSVVKSKVQLERLKAEYVDKCI